MVIIQQNANWEGKRGGYWGLEGSDGYHYEKRSRQWRRSSPEGKFSSPGAYADSNPL